MVAERQRIIQITHLETPYIALIRVYMDVEGRFNISGELISEAKFDENPKNINGFNGKAELLESDFIPEEQSEVIEGLMQQIKELPPRYFERPDLVRVGCKGPLPADFAESVNWWGTKEGESK